MLSYTGHFLGARQLGTERLRAARETHTGDHQLSGIRTGGLLPSRTISEKLRRYRMLNGLTIKELPKRLHIDDGTIHRIESDKGKHFQKTLKRIAGFLN